MDTATLTSRLTQAENRYNELLVQRQDIDAEMNRLQGEYRVLKDLQTAGEDPAKVIKAKPESE